MTDTQINVDDILEIYRREIGKLTQEKVVLEAQLIALRKEANDDGRSETG